jgi:hypothetical protein
MTTRSNRLFRTLTNPAATIAFAVIGVAVGVLAISRENGTRTPKNGGFGSYDIELRDLRSEQVQLRQDIDALKEKNKVLTKSVSELSTTLQEMGVKEINHSSSSTPCKTAWLIVRSNVNGDTFYLDDVAKGPTSKNRIPTCAGSKRIRVTKPGFEPISKTVDLVADTTQTVRLILRSSRWRTSRGPTVQ